MAFAIGMGRLLSAAHEENVKLARPCADAPHTVFQQLTMACILTGSYAKGVEYALLGLADAPDDAQLHGLLAINYAGLNDISKAKDAFECARQSGPWVERALADGFAGRKAEHLQRATTLLRIAAGLEDPSPLES